MKLKRRNRIVFFIISLAVLLTFSRAHCALAQTPTPTPESDEVKRLKEEKAQSELRKGIAEDRKAELEATFPKPSTTPLEGKTELDAGVKLESEILAYREMSKAADEIVKDIKTNGGISTISALAVHNDRDLKALMGYMVIKSQLDLMKQEYEKNIKTEQTIAARNLNALRVSPIAEGLGIAQSVLGSFVDLISLLRTDTKVTGMEFSVDESAMVSQVFRALRGSGAFPSANLYYPAMFPPNIGADKQFKILGAIETVNLIREHAAELIVKIDEAEKASAEQKDAIAGMEKKLKADKENISLLDKELERLQKIYWRWPSSRLAERIEEVGGQIAKLHDEILKLPGAIKDGKAELEQLTKQLDELYSKLLPEVTKDEAAAAVDVAIAKLLEAEKILGRPFTHDELNLLFTEMPEGTQKALIAEAAKHKHASLSQSEEDQLVSPLSGPEKNALKKISDKQASEGVLVVTADLQGLSIDDKATPLGQLDRIAMLSDADQAALRTRKKNSLANLKALNDQFDKLKAELIKVDNGSGINALTSYLQAENFRNALGCDPGPCANAYILQLKVIRAAGNNKVKRNLVRDVFAGPNISHSGGTIVEYLLYNIDGQAKSSNTFTMYSGYVKASDIPK